MRLLTLAGALLAAAQIQTGPRVGTEIPHFAAPDQSGRVQTLESIAGPKGALIVFYRSADWCPYCKVQLVELQHDLPRIKAQGYGLAGVSYDSVEILKNFAGRRGITFPLLSDPDSKIIRSFGILNETAPKDTPFWGICYPGTYLVDHKGVVIAKYFAEDNGERDTAAELLMKQFGINTEEARGQSDTKYFRISTSASNELVHEGQHISLRVDLELKPKMHVYAPGVQDGYIPIQWTMAENAAFQASPVEFPKPQVLRLDVIHESAPVYFGKVRLAREIVIGKDADVKARLISPQTLVLEGALRYQVCDDKECYVPSVSPLKWVLQFEGLDRQRVPTEMQRKISR